MFFNFYKQWRYKSKAKIFYWCKSSDIFKKTAKMWVYIISFCNIYASVAAAENFHGIVKSVSWFDLELPNFPPVALVAVRKESLSKVSTVLSNADSRANVIFLQMIWKFEINDTNVDIHCIFIILVDDKWKSSLIIASCQQLNFFCSISGLALNIWFRSG